MLAGLSRADRTALKGLTTRETDDFSIALLDAWAVAADVITFYTERIANEHYLGTATERGSIAGQAALLGYRLKPGVAASAWLAVTAEATPGGPEGSAIPAGTRVQTIPDPGDLPQSFETAAPIVAYPAWNRLELRMFEPRTTANGGKAIVLAGVETGLRPGDEILTTGVNWRKSPGTWQMARVQDVKVERDTGTTHVEAIPNPIIPAGDGAELQIFALRHRSTLFGANAIDPKLLPTEVRGRFTSEGVGQIDSVSGDWRFDPLTGKDVPGGKKTSVPLSASYPGVEPSGLAVLTNAAATMLCDVIGVAEGSVALYGISAQVTSLEVGETSSVPRELAVATTSSASTELAVSEFGGTKTRGTVVSFCSDRLTFAPVAITRPLWGDVIQLASPVPGLREPHDVLVRGKRVRMAAPDKDDDGWIDPLEKGEPVIISLALIEGDPTRRHCVVLEDSGRQVAVDVPLTNLTILPPHPDDPIVGEVVTVEAAERIGLIDELVLVEPLRNVYSRDARIEIFGNVAAAAHGETAPRETLGSGDGARAFQTFTLRKAPLTYVPSEEPGGAASSLDVRVNDIRWHEVPTLFGRGPRDRVYTTAIDDAGAVTITFGDGVTGARLPTGYDNVVAHYRTGIGRAGEARAEQIALPVARPLGMKGAVNPLPAAGGQEPQTAADARANAPRSVLTLGRVVSLQDYADFAADYAGIAKATATWTWDTHRRGVHVTIASADGQPIDTGSTLLNDVRRALRSVSDPRVPLEVKDFRPRRFTVGAHLRVHPDHDPERVRDTVVDSLVRRYAFDRRSFGEGVSLSELALAIHAIEGVEGVRIERLHPSDDRSGTFSEFLSAEAPTPGGSPTTRGAEILTLANKDALLEVDW
ncbi:putative baseplate assembly protein [Microbacterium oryzae]